MAEEANKVVVNKWDLLRERFYSLTGAINILNVFLDFNF